MPVVQASISNSNLIRWIDSYPIPFPGDVNTTNVTSTQRNAGPIGSTYTASASSQVAPGLAYTAFDWGTLGNRWSSSSGSYNTTSGLPTTGTYNGIAGSWLKIEFPQPFEIASFLTTSQNARAITLYGTNENNVESIQFQGEIPHGQNFGNHPNPVPTATIQNNPPFWFPLTTTQKYKSFVFHVRSVYPSSNNRVLVFDLQFNPPNPTGYPLSIPISLPLIRHETCPVYIRNVSMSFSNLVEHRMGIGASSTLNAGTFYNNVEEVKIQLQNTDLYYQSTTATFYLPTTFLTSTTSPVYSIDCDQFLGKIPYDLNTITLKCFFIRRGFRSFVQLPTLFSVRLFIDTQYM